MAEKICAFSRGAYNKLGSSLNFLLHNKKDSVGFNNLQNLFFCSQADSNRHYWRRRPALYPLSYENVRPYSIYHLQKKYN